MVTQNNTSSNANVFSIVFIALMSLGFSVEAHADPCYTNVSGTFMQLTNGTLESCLRVIRAAGNSSGQWGSHRIDVSNGQFYVDGQLFGTPRSSHEEGTALQGGEGYNLEGSNARYYNQHQLPISGGQYTGAR